jgi:branched-chain amino acid transport system permease protein
LNAIRGLLGASSTRIAVAMAMVCWVVLATQSGSNIFLYSRVCLAGIGALGLNLLMGTAGQVSVGNSAFLAIGGFSTVAASQAGIPFPLDVLVGVCVAALSGLIVGLPAMRLRGLYLMLSTLAAHFIVLYIVAQYQTRSAGTAGFSLRVVFDELTFAEADRRWAWVATGSLFVVLMVVRALTTGGYGDRLRFLRDHEQAAPALGISVTRLKLAAFVSSSAIISFAGGMQAHIVGSVSTDHYQLSVAIGFIAMIVIGGLDSRAGAIIGATVVTLLPTFSTNLVDRFVTDGSWLAGKAVQLSTAIYGLLIIIFIAFAPYGLAGIGKSVRLMRWRGVRRAWAGPRGGPRPPVLIDSVNESRANAAIPRTKTDG